MGNKNTGLYNKYTVRRNDLKDIPLGCVVLEWKDPLARMGIRAFSTAVRLAGYIRLADDLDARLEQLKNTGV